MWVFTKQQALVLMLALKNITDNIQEGWRLKTVVIFRTEPNILLVYFIMAECTSMYIVAIMMLFVWLALLYHV